MRILLLVLMLLSSLSVFANKILSFHHAVSSPDGHWIAFIKSTKKIIPAQCFTSSDDDSADTAIDPDTGLTIDNTSNENVQYAKQIWIYNTKSKKEHLLVANNFSCNHPKLQMLDPQHLRFSLDSKKLYFISTGWVTSGALHVVNVNGENEHYLIPVNSFSIVQKGQYKGYLIVRQHRYFVDGGTYNWLWLFSPSGKKIGPLGRRVTVDQKKYLES